VTGIEPLEAHAKLIADIFPRTEMYREWRSRLWTDDENIELFVRAMLRREFEKLLQGQLMGMRLQELQEVLFTFTYPTYDRKPSM
jgi:hypothetical protein